MTQLIREIRKGLLDHNEGVVSASKQVALACAPSMSFNLIGGCRECEGFSESMHAKIVRIFRKM